MAEHGNVCLWTFTDGHGKQHPNVCPNGTDPSGNV